MDSTQNSVPTEVDEAKFAQDIPAGHAEPKVKGPAGEPSEALSTQGSAATSGDAGKDRVPGSRVEEPTSDGQAAVEYEAHPLALLFPPMNEEYEGFKESIRRAGKLNHAIILYEGKILDGLHRYRACRELGIKPDFQDFVGPGTPEQYVIDQNLNRRHLTESVRAMVAAKIANLGEGRPEKTARNQAVSQTDAAKRLRVSRSSVQVATKVLKSGTPELARAVEKEEISLSKAAGLAKTPKEEQAKLLAEHQAGKNRPSRSRKKDSIGAKPDRKTSAPAGAKTSSSLPWDSSPQCDDAGDADRETATAINGEESRSDDAEDEETCDVVYVQAVAHFGDYCRDLEEDLPKLIRALRNGLNKSIKAKLRKYLSQGRAVFEKVAEALDHAEAANKNTAA